MRLIKKFKIKSKTKPSVSYIIKCEVILRDCVCECMSSMYRRADCRHVRLVKEKMGWQSMKD